MFYNKRKITYPSKSVLEDVLTRYSVADQESFTPYAGMYDKVKKFLNEDELALVGITSIIQSGADYSPNKQRPIDNMEDRQSAKDIIKYYTRLEDIEQSNVEIYVKQVLSGYKLNNKGIRDVKKNMVSTLSFYDEEDGAYVSESDLEEKVFNGDTLDLLAAKEKLPYLLKILHEGSKELKGSLLSFLISREIALSLNFSGVPRSVGLINKLAPRDLDSSTLYYMTIDGAVKGTWNVRDHNSNPTFIKLKEIILGRGEYENNRYFKVCEELLEVCSILDVDITDEDATLYDEAFMNQVVCSYLASNEEYLDLYGTVDLNILNVISSSRLFEPKEEYIKKMAASAIIEERANVQVLADSVASNIHSLFAVKPDIWSEDIGQVSQVLHTYAKRRNIVSKEVSDYKSHKGMLTKADGMYVMLKLDGLMDTSSIEKDWYVMISTTGYLVKLKDLMNDRVIEYIAPYNFIGGGKIEWKTLFI